MLESLHYFASKLRGCGLLAVRQLLLLACDEERFVCGELDQKELCFEVQDLLNLTALIAGLPALPIVEILLDGASETADRVTPLDTETRTFLHDIPLVRQAEVERHGAQVIADKLRDRRGVIVEGLGLLAAGGLTVEQAYVNFCSLLHATQVKVLLDLLRAPLPQAQLVGRLHPLRERLETPLPRKLNDLAAFDLDDSFEVRQAMVDAGQRTVDLGLVDSFFGNISVATADALYISQTGASLDRLEDCIDLVPHDDSTCAGLTASSELAAHRAIFAASGARSILHGHPLFAVILSLLCEETECKTTDCWKDCVKIRRLNGRPVVAGEVGSGGLAQSLPPVIAEQGLAVVYGHGVFAIGPSFAEPLGAMIDFENWCRRNYLQRLVERLKNANLSL